MLEMKYFSILGSCEEEKEGKRRKAMMTTTVDSSDQGYAKSVDGLTFNIKKEFQHQKVCLNSL